MSFVDVIDDRMNKVVEYVSEKLDGLFNALVEKLDGATAALNEKFSEKAKNFSTGVNNLKEKYLPEKTVPLDTPAKAKADDTPKMEQNLSLSPDVQASVKAAVGNLQVSGGQHVDAPSNNIVPFARSVSPSVDAPANNIVSFDGGISGGQDVGEISTAANNIVPMARKTQSIGIGM